MPMSAPLSAQEVEGDEGSAPVGIVVTAQNRVEDIQDVPIAMVVVSGATLRERGVTDFTAMQRIAPELAITSDTSNTRVSLRGIGSLSNAEAQDQTIAVAIDGEYVNRPNILNVALFDIDHIEVLRGPQGTLSGRNSTGGAVNIITRKPDDRLAANGALTFGNDRQIAGEGGIDLPLGQVGALRLAGFVRSRDGYSAHPNAPFSPTAAFVPNSGRRSDDEDARGGRASLRLRPALGLTIDAAIEYIVQDNTPAAQAWADMTVSANGPGSSTTTCANGWTVIGTVAGGVQCLPTNTHLLAAIDRHTYASPVLGVGNLHQTSTALRGRVAYDLGSVTLTYTGGYRTTTSTGWNTLSPAFAFTNFGGSVKTQSHEWRANGQLAGVQWQAGVFHFREQQATSGGLYTPFAGPSGSYVNYFRHPTDSGSWSAFGQFEVPLSAKLTAVAGGRFTRDTRSAAYRNYAFAFDSGIAPLTDQPSVTKVLHYAGSKATWLAGLNFKPDSAVLIYARASTGYKAGGFDGAGTIFRPERNMALEGGVKASFTGGNANLALFHYDYSDLQNDVLLNPAIGAQTFNAGKARIYGIEAATTLHATRNDTISASASVTHARYDDFIASVQSYNIGNAPATPVTMDLNGNRLPQAPEYVLTLGWDHLFRLPGGATITASATTRLKGDYFLDFYNYADSHQGAHTETDLGVIYRPANARFGVQLFVRNLEDYRALAYAGNVVVPGIANVFNWQFGAPRTYGARLSFDW